MCFACFGALVCVYGWANYTCYAACLLAMATQPDGVILHHRNAAQPVEDRLEDIELETITKPETTIEITSNDTAILPVNDIQEEDEIDRSVVSSDSTEFCQHMLSPV